MEKMINKKYDRLPSQVEFILENNPLSRNNDFILWAELCEAFYPKIATPLKNHRTVANLLTARPSMDKIARARRTVIKRTGLYHPTDKKITEFRKAKNDRQSQ